MNPCFAAIFGRCYHKATAFLGRPLNPDEVASIARAVTDWLATHKTTH